MLDNSNIIATVKSKRLDGIGGYLGDLGGLSLPKIYGQIIKILYS